MTKIQIYSDLHCEFGQKVIPKNCNADVVINAGDFSNNLDHIKLMREWHSNSKIIYIAGNHEFYGTNIVPNRYRILHSCSEKYNIKFLQNEVFQYKDILFIGATLWTDFNLYGNQNNHKEAFRRINDCRHITFSPRKTMRSVNCIAEFNISLQFIKEQILLAKEKNLKTVVVTHHGVSSKSVHAKYGEHYVNTAFSSNLDDFILTHEPDIWVHGHTHDSFDYNIGKTRIIVNPKGYESFSGKLENSDWKEDLVIEI